MSSYRLTDDAEEDLIGIWLYSNTTWGQDQADRYHEQLQKCCDRIAQGTIQTKPVDGCKGVFIHRCEHHYIFYTRMDGFVVLAILYEGMDLPNRLADRLNRM